MRRRCRNATIVRSTGRGIVPVVKPARAEYCRQSDADRKAT